MLRTFIYIYYNQYSDYNDSDVNYFKIYKSCFFYRLLHFLQEKPKYNDLLATLIS